jgi:hypothetical protein
MPRIGLFPVSNLLFITSDKIGNDYALFLTEQNWGKENDAAPSPW